MAGTGRHLEYKHVLTGQPMAIEIDSDVLVTEQLMIDTGLWSSEAARALAPQVVDAALNASCSCCAAEGNPGGLPNIPGRS